jgi:hypothetical protein
MVFVLAVVVAAVWPGDEIRANQTAGNGFYTVVVEDAQGKSGIGVFAAEAGPAHPAGGGKSILFQGDAAGNKHGSYITVRSWTTGTDYVQTEAPVASGNLVTRLDAFGGTALLDAALRTTYDVTAQDQLSIVWDARVDGTGEASAIVLRVEIGNTGDIPVALGVRYLLDLELAGDDGPAFGPADAAGLGMNEISYTSLPEFRIESSTPVTLGIFGRGARVPDKVTFAYWPEASGAAFDYETDERDIASDSSANDSALLVFFGAREADAIVLAPGGSAELAITLSHRRLAAGVPPDVPAVPGSDPAPLPAELPRTGARFVR